MSEEVKNLDKNSDYHFNTEINTYHSDPAKVASGKKSEIKLTLIKTRGFFKNYAPILAQATIVIFAVIALPLTLCGDLYDNFWNLELELNNESLSKSLKEFFNKSGRAFGTKNLPVSSRESTESLISMLIQGYVFLISLLHISVYFIYKNENYRIKFGKVFNGFIALLYLACLFLILDSTITINVRYEEPNLFHFFDHCRIASYLIHEDHSHVFDELLTNQQRYFMCQRYGFKFGAIGLLLANVLISCGIIFFTRSVSNEVEEEIEKLPDLLYDGSSEQIFLNVKVEELD